MASTLINPCDVTVNPLTNTGINCDSVLGLPKGLWLVPPNVKFTASDLADPVQFFDTKRHAAGSIRFYPILDQAFDYTIARDGDVTEANPVAGTTEIIRLGGLTITYTFKKGGLVRAKALLSFFNKGYSFIPVDVDNQFQVRLNSDGTYSGLKAFSVTPNFNPATSTTAFKNIVVVTTSYDEYVRYSVLRKSDTDLYMNGLLDTKITGTGTTTALTIAVNAISGGTDLVAAYQSGGSNALASLANFVIKNKATGATVTPTAISASGSNIVITGTFVTGQTYIVDMAEPAALYTNNIIGYENIINAEILIP